MILVKIFSDFCTSETCQEIFHRVWPSDETIQWTTEESFTHALLLNHAMPTLTLPPSNVIGLALEPPEFLRWTTSQTSYVKSTVSKYLIGSTDDTSPFVAHHGFLWHIPYVLTVKTELMSIMVSDKAYAPGHKYRHELVRAILQTDLPVDIYGRGCPSGSDSRLKGNFTESEPYDAYRFHIAIENFQIPAYFSEKVSNPLQRQCTPIYWGATILPFEDFVIRLSGTLEQDMNLVQSICENPEKYAKVIDSDKVARDLDIRMYLKQQWM
jgi:hypothetical protein